MAKHDTFCWYCSKANGSISLCSKCVRSFHWKCLKNGYGKSGRAGGENWLCPICVKIQTSKYTDEQKKLDALPILINRVMKEKEFESFKDAKNYLKSSVVEPMDLTRIKERIHTYSSFAEFTTDLEWISHNSLTQCQEFDEQIETADALVDYIEEEIESLKKCTDCYRHANESPDEWFTMICSMPHIVLWAKVEGFNYWPVKFMTVNESGVNVRFFGDHTHQDVAISKCYLYSKDNPGKPPQNLSTKKNQLYKKALEECNQYIENLRQKFGAYRLATEKTPCDPLSFKRYMTEAMPGFKISLELLPPIDLSQQNDDGSINEVTFILNGDQIDDSIRNDVDSNNQVDLDLIEPAKLSMDDDMMVDLSASDDNRPKKARYSVEKSEDPEMLNLSKVKSCMTQSARASEYLITAYAQLQEKLKDMQAKHDAEINVLNNDNKELMSKIATLSDGNQKHTSKIAELEKTVERYDEGKANAIDEVKKQCKDEYTQLLEQAKKMKFCGGCGAGKLQDQIYICNSACNKREKFKR
ncbi:protein kinase C-binding protein 1-like isoform X2 [Contarinia nasturtii]|uniref:protein kinase C-binding protein 1-like isoform X2 n=1 Tax=Contarinia nasturtii TaxID=265458 RepID=UPI0012D47C84|nr:protein kinase C-binding protein 1-like isoform X2 [Contarinia nasturtii]